MATPDHTAPTRSPNSQSGTRSLSSATPPLRWPLSTGGADGLAVAAHDLHEYVITPGDELGARVLRLR